MIDLNNFICPMCGGLPKVEEEYDYCPERYDYYYLECSCGMRTVKCTTIEEAVKIWLKRYKEVKK